MRNVPTKEGLLLVVGLGLLSYAFINLGSWFAVTHGTAPAPNWHDIVTTATAVPSEKPVPENAVYNVPGDQPKKILIPSIGLEGFIQRVGQGQQAEIGAPSNVHYAGWYTGSVKPGEAGLSVIDGHVSGRYSSALFARLANLQAGAEVTVQFGDDTTRHFTVIAKRQLPRAAAADYLLTKQADIDQQLNLITCAGLFDKQSALYTDRVVVVTKRID